MGFDIASAAYQTGSGLLGTGLGILMQKANDKRQLKQQGKLQAMQIGGQKDMTDYNMMKQMEMWKNTSYPAQMEMMKKAGLNPGLMYGMGGGGGQTTGSASGNVTGGVAPSGGGEIPMGIEKVMALSLLKAQKENIEADTENKKADIPVKGAQVPNIQANTANTQANTGLTEVKTELAKIEKEIAGRSKEDVLTTIGHNALKVIDEARSALYKANADEATWEMEIEKVKVDLTGMYLRNDETAMKIAVDAATINKISTELVQGWHKLNIDFANANTGRMKYILEKWVNDVSNSTKLKVETVKGIVQAILIKGR